MSSRLTKYSYFNPDEPYDEDRIKTCHKFQWRTFEGGARFRTRPSAVWCKEAKHFLKSLKKSKSKKSRMKTRLYVENATRGMSDSQKIAYAKKCRSSSVKCREAKAFARSSWKFRRSKQSSRSRVSLAETTSKYTNRPSPPYKANNHCGETMKGNDGEMYLSKKGSNRVCRWVSLEGKRTRSRKGHKSSFSGKKYKTLHNGGEPFLVTVNGNDVRVTIAEKEDPNYGEEVYRVTAEKIFVGDSRPSYDEGNYDWKKGTSVLLKIKPNKYVHIGEYIGEFSTEKGDEIVKYYTPTGSSAVIYPYAIGKNNTYLMTSDKDIIPHDVYDPDEMDPYEFFWRHNSKQKQKKHKKINMKKIHESLY